jgi:NAD(P)-dependent dehydrogenase (short-subunit alcohol dehydrogenase family)
MAPVPRGRQQEAKLKGIDEATMREQYLGRISLRRMVTADDVALMCLFLCSPAGQNITGQAISVDGNVESAELVIEL